MRGHPLEPCANVPRPHRTRFPDAEPGQATSQGAPGRPRKPISEAAFPNCCRRQHIRRGALCKGGTDEGPCARGALALERATRYRGGTLGAAGRWIRAGAPDAPVQVAEELGERRSRAGRRRRCRGTGRLERLDPARIFHDRRTEGGRRMWTFRLCPPGARTDWPCRRARPAGSWVKRHARSHPRHTGRSNPGQELRAARRRPPGRRGEPDRSSPGRRTVRRAERPPATAPG